MIVDCNIIEDSPGVLCPSRPYRLWSKDGGQKDIDPETQSINRL